MQDINNRGILEQGKKGIHGNSIICLISCKIKTALKK